MGARTGIAASARPAMVAWKKKQERLLPSSKLGPLKTPPVRSPVSTPTNELTVPVLPLNRMMPGYIPFVNDSIHVSIDGVHRLRSWSLVPVVWDSFHASVVHEIAWSSRDSKERLEDLAV